MPFVVVAVKVQQKNLFAFEEDVMPVEMFACYFLAILKLTMIEEFHFLSF